RKGYRIVNILTSYFFRMELPQKAHRATFKPKENAGEVLNRVCYTVLARHNSESLGPTALLEGEGKNLMVLGFNRSQRKTFLKMLLAYGLGDGSWVHFMDRPLGNLKKKPFQ